MTRRTLGLLLAWLGVVMTAAPLVILAATAIHNARTSEAAVHDTYYVVLDARFAALLAVVLIGGLVSVWVGLRMARSA